MCERYALRPFLVVYTPFHDQLRHVLHQSWTCQYFFTLTEVCHKQYILWVTIVFFFQGVIIVSAVQMLSYKASAFHAP